MKMYEGCLASIVRSAGADNHRLGLAWIALSVVIGLHVADEAATGFLSVYNPAVLAIRERFPFLPLPTFTFGLWLTGLCLGVLVLLSLSPLAFRGNRWAVRLSYPLGVLMFANGLGHVGGSFYLGRLMPGVCSAPLLLLASSYLLVCARQQRRKPVGTG